VGGLAPGDGLRLRHDLLAPPARLAARRRLAALRDLLLAKLQGAGKLDWSRTVIDSAQSRALGGVEGSGPIPTDRGRPGVKHHVITDGNGVPLACVITGANAADVTELVPLVDSIGPVAGKPGRPRQQPSEPAGSSSPARRCHAPNNLKHNCGGVGL
jgi:hypothetical protein